MILCLFVKQKTAYEVRISDWSSDVCSSDLPPLQVANASKNDEFNYSSSLSSSAAAKPRSSSPPRSTSLSGESPSSSTSMSRSSSPTKSARSEEHTSELQSLMRISYAVFCLKKKTKYIIQQITQHHTYLIFTSQW